MPRFPNELDKNTFRQLIPDNSLEGKFLHAETLKNLEEMEKQGERASNFYY